MGGWASCLVVKDAQVRVGNSKLNMWGRHFQNKVVYLVSFNAIVIQMLKPVFCITQDGVSLK
jgi:hypothetical protein